MIAVTGATGHLGQLVIAHLLKRGTPAKDIVAVVRDKSKAAELKSKGVEIREANYTSPETLIKALAGVDRVLLISGNEVGQRLAQHQNVINAAKQSGVKRILYTSILKADTSKMQLAAEHIATEKAIRASGLPFVFLRNSWYIENYTGQLAGTLQHGAIAGSAKNGKVSVATRSDYAEAAAAALLDTSSENKVYELGGAALTLPELAKAVTEISGKKVEYRDLPVEDFAKMLASFGVPVVMANVLADCDLGILRGELFTDSKDLEKLIGHAPSSIPSAIKSAVQAVGVR